MSWLLIFPRHTSSMGWALLLLLSIISYWQVITGILRAVISCCEIMWILEVISLSHSQVCEGSVQMKTRSSWAPPVALWSTWSAVTHAHTYSNMLTLTCTYACMLQSSFPLLCLFSAAFFFWRNSLGTHFPWHRNVSCGSSKWRPSVEP